MFGWLQILFYLFSKPQYKCVGHFNELKILKAFVGISVWAYQNMTTVNIN